MTYNYEGGVNMKKRFMRVLGIVLSLALLVMSAPIVGVSAQATEADFTYTVNADGTATITGYTGTAADVTIPASVNGYPVTVIGSYAFYNQDGVLSLTIPDGVTTIKSSAFYSCVNVRSISIPESTTTIEYLAFYGCVDLVDITLPGGLTTIESSLFARCSSLKSIVIPEGVTTIKGYAFNQCSSLENVVIPSSVTTLEWYVFQECMALQTITLPKLSEIGSGMFYNCRSLKVIEIPEGVTSIGEMAFRNCYALETVVIPDTVTAIGKEAFQSCTALEKVIIPKGVTTIGEHAFYNCTALKTLVLPNEIDNIGISAFYDCYSLNCVYYEGTAEEWESITIEAGNTFLYSTRVDITGLTEVDDVVYGLRQDGTATVINYKGDATVLILPSTVDDHTVTTIGSVAFEKCTQLQSITLPKDLTSIEFGAFCNCDSLLSVDIPDGVTAIRSKAFSACTNLREVKLSDALMTIGEYAFFGCDELQEIMIPGSVRVIEYGAFENCAGLEHLEIYEGVTVIGGYAFSGCGNIQSVYFSGEETAWKEIDIGIENTELTQAPRVYGAVQSYDTVEYQGNPNGTITIVNVDDTAAVVTIPKVIGGAPVTSLKQGLFEDAAALETVKYYGSESDWQALTQGEQMLPEGVYILFDLEQYTGYPDVSESAWFYDAVEHVSVKGYMTGFASGKFGPAANMQRQDFVLILARIAGADLEQYKGQTGGLKDVNPNAYYAPAVAWAVENGIITGYQNGNFGVGHAITREQVCTILYRYKGSPKVENAAQTLDVFPDKNKISGFAKDAAVWAVQNGVIKGMESGDFAPVVNSSRAHVATIIMRLDRAGIL